MPVDISTLMDIRRRMGFPVGPDDHPDNQTVGVRLLFGGPQSDDDQPDPLAAVAGLAAAQPGADAAPAPAASQARLASGPQAQTGGAGPGRSATQARPEQSEGGVTGAVRGAKDWIGDRLQDASDYVQDRAADLGAGALDTVTSQSQLADDAINWFHRHERTRWPKHDGSSPVQPKSQGVDFEQMKAIMPDASRDKIELYTPILNGVMDKYGIATAAQRAAFLAQIAQETGQLSRLEENLDFTTANIRGAWPRRYPTDASTLPYKHNPRALGDKSYGGRMGNNAPDDGYVYRGRGFIMTTGRDKCREAGMEQNPDGLLDPQTAGEVAGLRWQREGFNNKSAVPLNEADFYKEISRRLNGGDNGRAQRWNYYQNALKALAR